MLLARTRRFCGVFLVCSALDGKCFTGAAGKTLFFGLHSAANFLNIRVFYVSLIELVAAIRGMSGER